MEREGKKGEGKGDIKESNRESDASGTHL
jgi:hypothetical protein